MLSNKIKYKFDFGNAFNCLISYIVEIFENMGLIILSWILVFALENLILENLPDCFIKEIILQIITVITVIVDLCFAVLIFIPKRIVLTDDKILVYRFCFPLQITFWDIRGFNDKIFYSQITLCEEYVDKIPFGARKPFFRVNNNSLVEIRTKYKTYLLPIKNHENFIDDINSRIQSNTNNNTSS